MYTGKKVAGLWIDHDKAILIETPDQSNTGDFVQIKKIKSNIHGSFGSSQNANTNKISKELHDFFRQVSQQLGGKDVVYVIGPGKAQEEFRNYLKKEGNLKSVTIELDTADAHISDNQMVAKVRSHFKA
jgi:hypothetical protein